MSPTDTFLINNMYLHLVNQHPEYKNNPKIYNLVKKMYKEGSKINNIDTEEARMEILKQNSPRIYNFVMDLKSKNPNITKDEITKKLHENYDF